MKNCFLFVFFIVWVFTSCMKAMTLTEEVKDDYVLLKNGKDYPKDSVLTMLSLYSKIPVDSIEYRPQDSSFFYLGWTFELDPINYLNLK